MTNLIAEAVKILNEGGVVVYPTDTAYGLAVDATNDAAVEKLYYLKGRDFQKPIHIIYPDADWLNKIVKLNDAALKLMKAFLPGPLTIVLPLIAEGESWKKLSAGSNTMGVRLPNNQTALDLVKKFGKPITTTSANLSNQPICYSIDEVKTQFANAANQPDFYLDGGQLAQTLPSTVVSLIEGVKILRAGPIPETEIQEVLKG